MNSAQAPKSSGIDVSLAMMERYRDEFEGGRSQSGGDRRLAFEDWLDQLLRLDPALAAHRNTGRKLAETWGADAQMEAARLSELLRKPLNSLSRQGAGGGAVGDALAHLSAAVERVDPGKFASGWFRRLLALVPGWGSPTERYAAKYRSIRSGIDSTLLGLERGRDELARDVVTLTEDQRRFRVMNEKLEVVIANAQRFDEELQTRVQRATADRKKYFEEEVLYPLRQRLLDLQQQLAVSQQGVIACDIVVRNNKELVRGVNRALNVTATALEVAASIVLSIENQKRAMAQVDAATRATSDLLAGDLRRVFDEMNAALKELGHFRSEAIPQMTDSTREFDKRTRDGAETIQRMERMRNSEGRLGQASRR